MRLQTKHFKNFEVFFWIIAYQTWLLAIVQTTYSPIEGEANSMIRQFLSIPYAAPADTTRWKSPESHVGWTSTLKTVDIPPGCPQKCTSSVPNMFG